MGQDSEVLKPSSHYGTLGQKCLFGALSWNIALDTDENPRHAVKRVPVGKEEAMIRNEAEMPELPWQMVGEVHGSAMWACEGGYTI